MKIQTITICLLLSVANLAYTAPSFNCSKAHKTVEKFICDNEFVSDLDNKLMATYENLKSEQTSDSRLSSLRKSQINWIRERNSCEDDYQGKSSLSECVKHSYNKRIKELREFSETKLEETESHRLYRLGNKAYRNGDYYTSVKYFNDAYLASGDRVDEVRALGANSENSKAQGNLLLAKKYAEKILEIDPTSQYAKNMISSYESSQQQQETRNSASSNSYSPANTVSNSTSNNQCMAKCAVQAFGSAVCEAKFQSFARNNLGTETYNFLSSSACDATISALTGQKISLEGMIVEAGLSWFAKSIGTALGMSEEQAGWAVAATKYGLCYKSCN